MSFTYGRIEQPPTDPVKRPRRHAQRKAKGQRDVEQLTRIGLARIADGVGDLGAAECEEQEEKGADEFAGGGDEVFADLIA